MLNALSYLISILSVHLKARERTAPRNKKGLLRNLFHGKSAYVVPNSLDLQITNQWFSCFLNLK